MASRSMKIAASVAIAAGIVVAVTIFVTGGSSTVAMAAVLEQLQTKCYEFEMTVRTDDGVAKSLQGMVLEPGKMRLEQRGGPGTIISIIDNDTGQSLILFERFKVAYRFDREEAKLPAVLEFLILPRRSIEDLWNLKAGDEIALGKRDFEDKSAEGFRVTQEDEEYTQTITVWAAPKSSHPLEVEIAWQSNAKQKAVLELMLSDFQAIAEPNTALFCTNVPEGYTVANSQTIEQLTAESHTSPSTTEDTSIQARTVLDAIALWATGRKQEAVELLGVVQWRDDFRFGHEHHLFTMSERQYISLMSADQNKVMADIMRQLSQCRELARELNERGRKARASKQVAQAEKSFSVSVHLGGLLNANRDMMLVVRMVGIAIQKHALTELSSLYEELGDTKLLRETQVQINHAEQQSKQIQNNVLGR